jgi:serine acetyltransferase
MGSLIMPVIKIADGAIIGARSVVTKNIGPYEIWAGNPARLIKKRFNEDVIELLQKIRWWNWDIEKIVSNIDVLVSNNEGKLKAIVK